MNKKIFATMGMAFSVVIILLGLLTMFGVLGGDANTASSAPYSYDSGYATFGADFYTYATNNAAEAASAGRTTAYNVYVLCELVKNACGVFMMSFGLLGLCYFGIVRCDCMIKDTEDNAAAEVNAAKVDAAAEVDTAEQPEMPANEAV